MPYGDEPLTSVQLSMIVAFPAVAESLKLVMPPYVDTIADWAEAILLKLRIPELLIMALQAQLLPTNCNVPCVLW